MITQLVITRILVDGAILVAVITPILVGVLAINPPHCSGTHMRVTLICVEVAVETQNVTLPIPKETLRKAKIIAV
ncbi:MAG: hypothetical protein ACUVWR_08680 [Anaerolineae bacterium]